MGRIWIGEAADLELLSILADVLEANTTNSLSGGLQTGSGT